MGQNLLHEDQSSRHKAKKCFIVFTIFFTLLICAIISVYTVLKHQLDSESPSANPTQAIRAACQLTSYYSSCVESMSSVHNLSHIIHPSDILRLSIGVAFRQSFDMDKRFQGLASKINDKNIKPVLINCQYLFSDSVSQLNRSLMITANDLGPDDKIVAVASDGLKDLMLQAVNNVGRCLDGLDAPAPVTTWQQIVKMEGVRMRCRESEIYMRNSLDILGNMDAIHEMFGPSVDSVLAYFLLGQENNVVTIALLCSQYLFLVFLLCSVLRVFV